MNDLVGQLQNLTPIVAIVLIQTIGFVYLIIKMNKSNFDNHKDKTLAFLTEQKDKDLIISTLGGKVIEVVEKNAVSHEKLSRSIDNNNVAIEKLNQTIISKL